jgi:hypothetical protein
MRMSINRVTNVNPLYTEQEIRAKNPHWFLVKKKKPKIYSIHVLTHLIVEIYIPVKWRKISINYHKNGLEEDRLGREVLSATSGKDSIDGQEVVRGPSVLTVPCLLRNRVSLYTALVPQRQIWHFQLWVVSVQFVSDFHEQLSSSVTHPVSRRRCCKCRNKSSSEWRPELLVWIPVQQYQLD